MMKRLFQSALCLILCPLLAAQQVAPPAGAPQSSTPAPATAAPRPLPEFITIPKDTKIDFVSLEEVSSATAIKGQLVRFAMANDVLVNGLVVIPKGTLASGVVTHVTKGVPGIRDGSLWVSPRIIFLNNGKTIKVSDTIYGSDIGPYWFAYTFLAPLMLLIWIGVAVDKVHNSRKNIKSLGKDYVIHVCKSLIWNGYTTNRTKIQSIDLPAAKSVPENAIPCKLPPESEKAFAVMPQAAVATDNPNSQAH
jgi:hypothetical protein